VRAATRAGREGGATSPRQCPNRKDAHALSYPKSSLLTPPSQQSAHRQSRAGQDGGVASWARRPQRAEDSIVVCMEFGLLGGCALEGEKCITLPSTDLGIFRAKARNRVSTQSMQRPLRGSTHTLKQGHHNHVVAGPVWLLVGAARRKQRSFALKLVSRIGEKTKHDFFFFSPLAHSRQQAILSANDN